MQVSLDGRDRQGSRRMRRVDSYLDLFSDENGGNDKQQEKKWGPGFHGFFFIIYPYSSIKTGLVANKQRWRVSGASSGAGANGLATETLRHVFTLLG